MAKKPTEKQLEARRKFAEASRERARLKKEAPETVSSETEIEELRREIQELKQLRWADRDKEERVGLSGGRLVGTVEKYDLTASVYPNPIERLMKEAKLKRFSFAENYDLNFEVGISEYTTIDNIRTKEPKFTLELVGRIYDEETGELTSGRYIISRLIMHEDPEAALVIAREQNLEVDEANEEDFLNEMRYIRMRDWLITCFIPAPQKKNNRKNEMVVGGKIVEFYEITADEEDRVQIPFEKVAGRKL